MHRRPLAETGSAPQDGSDHSGGISVQALYSRSRAVRVACRAAARAPGPTAANRTSLSGGARTRASDPSRTRTQTGRAGMECWNLKSPQHCQREIMSSCSPSYEAGWQTGQSTGLT